MTLLLRLDLFRIAWHCYRWVPPASLRTTVSLVPGVRCVAVQVDACCAHDTDHFRPWTSRREVREGLQQAGSLVTEANVRRHAEEERRWREMGWKVIGRG